jgi:hypothetical protein
MCGDSCDVGLASSGSARIMLGVGEASSPKGVRVEVRRGHVGNREWG